MNKLSIALLIIFLFWGKSLIAQPSFSGFEHLFSTPENYVITYTSQKPQVDGNLNDNVWKEVQWTALFQDIEGNKKPKPYYETRVKMIWSDSSLFVAAELMDDHIWANLRNHDDIVFYDNDFEVFISPANNTHQYFEIEVNALNTIFDLFLPKPYRNYGSALISWNTPGLKSSVKINGTLNNPKDKDTSWTVEMEIPFQAISMGNDIQFPKENNIWRINFSRVQWETEIQNEKYIKKKDKNEKVLPENNWVWSPQGVINMHCPERWGYLMFTHKKAGEKLPVFHLPYSEKQKQFLWLIYYRQKEYFSKNHQYASTLTTLGVSPVSFTVDGFENTLQMEASDLQFNASISKKGGKKIYINDEGLIIGNGDQ